MKKLRNIAFLTAIFTVISFFPLFARAAGNTISPEDYNAAVLAKKQDLEKKYGIKINYPQQEGKYAGIGTITLATLDTCLDYVTPAIVRQLSEYYAERNGVKLTITYAHTPSFKNEASNPVAAFTSSKSLVEVYAPKSGANMLVTGSSPIAIMHEIGHAYHEFIQSQAGRPELQRLWTRLNNGAEYSSGINYNKNAFVSSYAATSYEEDFAETFAHAFVCNRAGFSISKYTKDAQGNSTALGGKLAYLEKLIKRYSPSAEKAVANMRRLYSAPESVSYRGLRLQGSSMEYVGYDAPSGILKPILNSLPFEADSSKWVKSVGGWLVTAKNGKEYLAFPGGNYTQLKE